MQEENPAKIRETLQIAKFDMEKQDELNVPDMVTVSDKFYTKDRLLVSSTTFDIPGWLGEWSLHNVRLEVTLDSRLNLGRLAYPPGVDRRKKVAIIGSQEEYIPESPLNSDEWEVWGCNSLWWKTRDIHNRFRADRWFELHPMEVQTPTELERIHECPIPIYTLAPEPTVKNGMVFPLAQILANYPYDFFACTFAYQVALALYEGFEEIGIYGTELMFGTPRERLFELRSLEFWIGLAAGRPVGVTPDGKLIFRKIHFHPNSRLCKHPYRYGYDYEAEKTYCDNKMQFIGLMKQSEDEKDMEPNEARQWFKAEAAKEQDEYFNGGVPE